MLQLQPSDLQLIISIEDKRISRRIEALLLPEPITSDLLFQVYSFLGRYSHTSTSTSSKRSKYSSVRVDVNEVLSTLGTPDLWSSFVYDLPNHDVDEESHLPLNIDYYFDPLSVAGQRAAAIIPLLSQQLNHIHHRVILAPNLDITEFPLQNFYRYVSWEDRSVFLNLPRQHILTVSLFIDQLLID